MTLKDRNVTAVRLIYLYHISTSNGAVIIVSNVGNVIRRSWNMPQIIYANTTRLEMFVMLVLRQEMVEGVFANMGN